MSLTTRFTLAIGALVIATAGTVGYLTYRNIAAVAVPSAMVRAEAHVRILAGDLGNIVTHARADAMGFREGIGFSDVFGHRLDASAAANLRHDEWRARIARRLAAELEAKPDYAQYRLIGIEDGGREVIRVERDAATGLVRVVPDARLEARGERDYFKQTLAASKGTVAVSPVELDQERGGVEPARMPVIRVSTAIFGPDGQASGIFMIDVDLRPAFARINAATRPGAVTYVVNERGDYLAHQDASREFGYASATPFRIQDDFPTLGQAIATGEFQSDLLRDRSGNRFGVALASVRPAGGPRITVIEATPEQNILAAAISAVRYSSLLGGALAVFCAIVLAFLLARTLTRPLTQMTFAVADFAHDRPLSVPTGAGGEIGMLARAFEQMAHDVREKTAAARRDAAIFESIMSSIGEAVLLLDADGRILYANRAYQPMLGPLKEASAQDWIGSFELFQLDGVTPVPTEQRPIIRSLRGEQVDGYDLLYRTGDSDRLKNVMGSAHPIRDAAGTLSGAVIIFRDVTAAKQTEHMLHEAQKLDALGQLTGGVAHDFNNMLTVIAGSTEMLAELLADRPDLLQVAKLIDQAAERGAELTRHLLAFARKQPLEPRNVDVNRLVLDTALLLRPTLGEHIEIESMLKDDAQPARIDPSQLATALLNLAINARDAMPGGGKLTLETGNVVLDESYAQNNPEVLPGPYVMIAVSDTGIGIPAKLRDKVFEPFFTTKEVGKGTGLGLSMVYGFVKQSGGHIKIYSEEGHGTTIKLYLPRGDAQGETSIAAAPIVGGTETILVVEDDKPVRDFVVAQLRGLGYMTVTAADGNEALAQVEGGLRFDLLFTDVIMPGGLNGRQLADELAKRRPAAKVLYTSGYTENAIVHHGRLDAGVLLLAKPYRKSDLARMVRRALDRDPAAADHAVKRPPLTISA